MEMADPAGPVGPDLERLPEVEGGREAAAAGAVLDGAAGQRAKEMSVGQGWYSLSWQGH